ncbi:MAG: hypothetical protein ACO2PP_16660 [Thermocrinis sp.]|jgi:hypothetical protein|uniref:hypothetical protein n=1 Tax=Thermocrinis sp. TaxID=2024383 RepID=UPI003C008532
MSGMTLMDLIVPLRDEIEGFIARVDEEFLSMYREYSVFESILLHDEALEREKQEVEPLKKAYLRAAAEVFKFIPMSSNLPKVNIYEEFVKGLSGMEYEEYSMFADRRLERMLEKWKRGEIVVKEGERLRLDDEILETARYLVNVGVFSKYLQILELRRQMDEVKEFCKVSEKPLTKDESLVLLAELMDENDLDADAGTLETKYGVFLGCANWFDVLVDVWRMQKDAEEPILVSALYIYLKPIVEKAEFVKEYLEKFYRRQLRQYGETPFLNACGIALMKLGCDVKVEEPKSRSAEIVWYW